jgi:hypothetical protein
MWRERLATWNRWIPGWVVYFLAGWVLIRGAIVPSVKQILVFTVMTGIIGQLILLARSHRSLEKTVGVS